LTEYQIIKIISHKTLTKKLWNFSGAPEF